MAMRDMSNLSFEKDGLNLFAYCANRPLNVKEAKAVISPTDYLFNNTSVGQALLVGAAVLGDIFNVVGTCADFTKEIIETDTFKNFDKALGKIIAFFSAGIILIETGNIAYAATSGFINYWAAKAITWLVGKAIILIGGIWGILIGIVLTLLISWIVEELINDILENLFLKNIIT